MIHPRRNSPAAQRFAERRRREDEAPRLHDQVPSLVSLKLEIEDRSGLTKTKHNRRVIVDRAPALFLIPCADPRCADGEHDLTQSVMRALRARETSFHGEDGCMGSIRPSNCARVLTFDAVAEYQS